MVWTDCRKTYDMVPHLWILDCARMVEVAQNIITLIENTMANCKTALISNHEVIGTVDIKRGIFQGDSLSPLLFVIIMIPLSQGTQELATNSRKKDARSSTCLT